MLSFAIPTAWCKSCRQPLHKQPSRANLRLTVWRLRVTRNTRQLPAVADGYLRQSTERPALHRRHGQTARTHLSVLHRRTAHSWPSCARREQERTGGPLASACRFRCPRLRIALRRRGRRLPAPSSPTCRMQACAHCASTSQRQAFAHANMFKCARTHKRARTHQCAMCGTRGHAPQIS